MKLEEAEVVGLNSWIRLDELSGLSPDEHEEELKDNPLTAESEIIGMLYGELQRLREKVTENYSLLALFCEFTRQPDGSWVAEMFPGISAHDGEKLQAAARAHTKAHLELERLRGSEPMVGSLLAALDTCVNRRGPDTIGYHISDEAVAAFRALRDFKIEGGE